VCGPPSNGTAERFVKTMKRHYSAFMPKPDAVKAVRKLAIAFEHYNEEPLIARLNIARHASFDARRNH
jgi:transposase InsO family protein